MPDKRGLLNTILRRKYEKRDNELALIKQREIADSLREQYGVTITENTDTQDKLISKGFRKLVSDEAVQLNAVFQYVPQLMAAGAYQSAVNTAFKAATEGTYRISLGAGLHLCKSNLTPGALRAVGLSDTTNQIAGNAELFANDAVLTVSNAPQIALGVFNVASLITGQYFMAQVNAKLSELSASVNRIEQYLDISRRAELRAAFEELKVMFSQENLIKSNTIRLSSSASALDRIQHIARTSINISQDQITAELETVSERDKGVEVQRKVESVGKYTFEYHYAIQLYSIAKLFEVRLYDDVDPESLSTRLTEITAQADFYKGMLEKCQEGIAAYLDGCDVLNKRNWIQYIALYGSGVAVQAITGILGTPLAVNTVRRVDELFVDEQKKRKDMRVDTAKRYFEQSSNATAIDEPIKALQNYIDVVSKPVEFVLIDGEYYTNLQIEAGESQNQQ